MPKRLSGRWLDIPGYGDRYQVSLDGQVRSLSRIDDGGHRRTLRLLDPNTRRNGRRYVMLCKRGVSRSHCVSALLALALGIPNVGRFKYVIHVNRDNTDFRRQNLRWATLAEVRMNNGNKRSTRYYGVTRNARRHGVLQWIAVVVIDGLRHDLGLFATPEEAAYSYDQCVRRLRLDRPLNGLNKPAPFEITIKSFPGEVWRKFPGASKTHMISSKGRVRTLPHTTARGQRVLAKLRKISVNVQGSRTILIKDRRYSVAKIIAQTFAI